MQPVSCAVVVSVGTVEIVAILLVSVESVIKVKSC